MRMETQEGKLGEGAVVSGKYKNCSLEILHILDGVQLCSVKLLLLLLPSCEGRSKCLLICCQLGCCLLNSLLEFGALCCETIDVGLQLSYLRFRSFNGLIL